MAATKSKTWSEKFSSARRRMKQKVYEFAGRADSSKDTEAFARDDHRLEAAVASLREMKVHITEFLEGMHMFTATSQELCSDLRSKTARHSAASVQLVHGTGDGVRALSKLNADMDAYITTQMNLKLAVYRSCERVMTERLLRPIAGLLGNVDTVRHLLEKRRRYQTDVDAYKRKLDSARAKASKTGSASDHSEVTRQTSKLRDAKDRYEAVEESVTASLDALEASMAALTADVFHTQVAVTFQLHSFAADALSGLLPAVPQAATPMVEVSRYIKQASGGLVQGSGGSSASTALGSVSAASAGAGLDERAKSAQTRTRAGYAFPSLAEANREVARGESLPPHLWGTDAPAATKSQPGRVSLEGTLQTLHNLLRDPATDLYAMESGSSAPYAGEALAGITEDVPTPPPASSQSAGGGADEGVGGGSRGEADASPPSTPTGGESATGGFLATATFDFDSVDADEVCIAEGDVLRVSEAEGEWWRGTIIKAERDLPPPGPSAKARLGSSGLFPGSYVSRQEGSGAP